MVQYVVVWLYLRPTGTADFLDKYLLGLEMNGQEDKMAEES